MIGKSCFFIGHRNAPQQITAMHEEEIERHITQYGVTAFFVGGYGSFDGLAARCVIALKQRYLHISLTLLLPYHLAVRPVETPPGFDGTFYPDGMESVPPRHAISRANRLMVDYADYLICYVCHAASNARNLMEYAQRKKEHKPLLITNIAESPYTLAN